MPHPPVRAPTEAAMPTPNQVLDGLTGELKSRLGGRAINGLAAFTSSSGHPRAVTLERSRSVVSVWDLGAETEGGSPPPLLLEVPTGALSPDPRCVIARDGPTSLADEPCIVVGFGDGGLGAWDEHGALVRAWRQPPVTGFPRTRAVTALAWSGDRLVSGHNDGGPCVWGAGPGAEGEGEQGPLVEMPHTQAVELMQVIECEDGSRRVLAGYGGYQARLWDVETGALVKKIDRDCYVSGLMPLQQPDRAWHAIAAGWGGVLRVLDLEERAPEPSDTALRSALKLG
jgi:WD40 repeat protein